MLSFLWLMAQINNNNKTYYECNFYSEDNQIRRDPILASEAVKHGYSEAAWHQIRSHSLDI